MKKQLVELGFLKLMGIAVRTNNANEMDPQKSKIAKTLGNYWNNALALKLHSRSNPGLTYAVYTEFESDAHGEYTYFIGEQVDSFDNQETSKFQRCEIPPSSYQKFTTEPGKMPGLVIQAWQSIWLMNSSNLGGSRKYIADFEVYDQRATDPDNAIIDIYIGVNR